MMRLLLISMVFSISIVDWIVCQDVDRSCPPITCSESEAQKLIGMRVSCRCDNQCGDYNDCCSDAPNKVKSTNETLYSCTSLPTGAFFLKHHCPESSSKYQLKCSQSANFSDRISQMHLKIPVTSKSNKNITYGNIFCAFCDNLTTESLTSWNLKVVCGMWSTLITNITFNGLGRFLKNQPEMKIVLKFNNNARIWQYINSSVIANCSMYPQVPDSLMRVVRPCVYNLTSTCPVTFWHSNITQKCAKSQSIVHQKSTLNYYRNAYCALCNGVPLKNLSCYIPKPIVRPYNNFGRYAKILPPSLTNKTTTDRTYSYIAMKFDCKNLLRNIELSKVEGKTVLFRTLNKSFIRNITSINGTVVQGVQVCVINNETVAKLKESELNSTFFRYVVIFGCLSACTFLLLYIWNFFASNKLAHINEKLMLSFATAMLLGNIGFLYESLPNNIALSDHLIICAINNFLTYYGFLASFLWISSMAFDISSCIWSFAFEQAAVLHKNRTTLFLVYSLISWIIPAFITLTLIWYNFTGGVNLAYTCLLNNEVTLLWYFVIPLTICMSVNLAFYLCTVLVVFTKEGIIEKMCKSGIKLKLHACVVMTTNAMWLTIILAGYLNNHLLVVLFTGCDVFLGFVLYWSPYGKDTENRSESVSSKIIQWHRQKLMNSKLAYFLGLYEVEKGNTS